MEIKIAIIIERVSTKAVEGHESSDFNWCNTNNHQSNDISDIDYNTHISETAMSKWLPVLRPFLGPLRKSTKEITIPSLLVEKYFKPASDLAKVGAAVHRLFKEEFETCAVQMISDSENMKMIMDSTPKQGWFVRTASCSPKVTIRVLCMHKKNEEIQLKRKNQIKKNIQYVLFFNFPGLDILSCKKKTEVRTPLNILKH